MRIAILSKWPENELRGGGVSVHVTNLVRNLGEIERLKIKVISFGTNDRRIKIGNSEIDMIRSNKFYYIFPPLALIRMAIKIKQFNPDIIHIQGSNISPYSLYGFLNPSKKSMVITVHNISSQELVANDKIKNKSVLNRTIALFEKELIKRSDKIIVVGTRLGERIAKFPLKGNWRKKIIFIPNGVNLPKKLNKDELKIIRNGNGISDDELIIFHAKSMDKFNGQEYLINAMPSIIRQIPKARLILAGDGPLLHELSNKNRKMGLENKISFLGKISHELTLIYLAISDAVVVPSIRIGEFEEGGSIFLLEAMASEKAVVATSVGGNIDSIKNGINGILIPDRDSERIAEGVINILQDPVKASSMGEMARNIVENERSWKNIAEKTAELYDKMFKNN